eukprot:TRINITY_DN22030_c0_g1_i1.p2 TRINITY_DN22030_c0_g1~~TRINITY_DN22030_c0_g1_i1.p2  ORF type:complete len:194 (+),score=46.77 TRINITY_DN22030_c0_g1_i1:63-584(+)
MQEAAAEVLPAGACGSDLRLAAARALAKQWGSTVELRLRRLEDAGWILLRLPSGGQKGGTFGGVCRVRACQGKAGASVMVSVLVPEHLRGRGLGGRLVRAAFDAAAAAGSMWMYLWTDEAPGFYRHLGFSVCSAPTPEEDRRKHLIERGTQRKVGAAPWFRHRVPSATLPPAD